MPTSRYLLLAEAAEFARVSVSTMRFWATAKGLPTTKPGKKVLILESDLTDFIQKAARTGRPAISATSDKGLPE